MAQIESASGCPIPSFGIRTPKTVRHVWASCVSCVLCCLWHSMARSLPEGLLLLSRVPNPFPASEEPKVQSEDEKQLGGKNRAEISRGIRGLRRQGLARSWPSQLSPARKPRRPRTRTSDSILSSECASAGQFGFVFAVLLLPRLSQGPNGLSPSLSSWPCRTRRRRHRRRHRRRRRRRHRRRAKSCQSWRPWTRTGARRG